MKSKSSKKTKSFCCPTGKFFDPCRKKLGKFCAKLPKANFQKIIVYLGFLALGLILYFLRGQFIVATVNGRPISRLSLLRELEKQSGQRGVDSLITKMLIAQEAKKQGINITAEEIDQEIQEIEKTLTDQGQNLDLLLKQRGMSRTDLTEELKLQKVIEKMAVADITVNEEEVEKEFDQSKEFLPKDSNPEENKNNIKQQLEESKKNEAVQKWLQKLRDDAKINYLLLKPPAQ